MPDQPQIAVSPENPEQREKAAGLAEWLDLPLTTTADRNFPMLLVVTTQRLELRQTEVGAPGPVYADFLAGKADYRRRYGSSRDEAVVRAVASKRNRTPTVLDATGGLGRDGFVLAWHGCRVTLVERHPVIAALLADGLRRASQDEKIGPLIRERIRLVIGDSLRVMQEIREAKVTNHGIRRQGLAHLPSSKRLQGTGVHEQADNTADSVPCDSLLAKPPEVIYLDPMYPESGKSALVKKETQLLRLLSGPDGDSNELLPAALACGRQRVVVKRPIAAPPLTGRKPDLVQAAGAHRFDIYLG